MTTDAPSERRAARPPVDRRLEAIGYMLADGADALEAGRWSDRDAGRAMLAAAADALALAHGYPAALAVPRGAQLPASAARTIARACGDIDGDGEGRAAHAA